MDPGEDRKTRVEALHAALGDAMQTGMEPECLPQKTSPGSARLRDCFSGAFPGKPADEAELSGVTL